MCIISKYKSYFTDEKMEAEGGKTEQLVIAGGGGTEPRSGRFTNPCLSRVVTSANSVIQQVFIRGLLYARHRSRCCSSCLAFVRLQRRH